MAVAAGANRTGRAETAGNIRRQVLAVPPSVTGEPFKMRELCDFPPTFWSDRAEEARKRAEQMHDPVAKRMMELISEAYECLAERAVGQLRLQHGVRAAAYRN